MFSIVDTDDFIEWLLAEMRTRGMSQAELARAAGISRAAVSNILSRKRPAGKDVLTAFAKAFRLPPEIVFRKAGILPDRSNLDNRLELLRHILAGLPVNEQDEVIAYAEMKLKLREDHDAIESLRAELSAVPSDRQTEVLDILQAWLLDNGLTRRGGRGD